jgi:hypothetical protein
MRGVQGAPAKLTFAQTFTVKFAGLYLTTGVAGSTTSIFAVARKGAAGQEKVRPARQQLITDRMQQARAHWRLPCGSGLCHSRWRHSRRSIRWSLLLVRQLTWAARG